MKNPEVCDATKASYIFFSLDQKKFLSITDYVLGILFLRATFKMKIITVKAGR